MMLWCFSLFHNPLLSRLPHANIHEQAHSPPPSRSISFQLRVRCKATLGIVWPHVQNKSLFSLGPISCSNTDSHQAWVGAGEEGVGSGGWKEKTDVFIEAGGRRRDDNKVSIQIVFFNFFSRSIITNTCYAAKHCSNPPPISVAHFSLFGCLMLGRGCSPDLFCLVVFPPVNLLRTYN